MFDSYVDFSIPVAGTTISGRVTRPGSEYRPGLLLLHGHPQTHVMWHKVADELARDFVVVAADLPGYGDSTTGPETADHNQASKRTMARSLVEVMADVGRDQGFDRFAVCAHDRGARVAHRMCLDHPDVVTAAVLLDIAPTLDMYELAGRDFATAYWHWFFLIQPYPLPENLISANPDAYIEGLMGSRYAGLAPFTADALQAYRHALSKSKTVHAICEDYRASATIDLDHDRADRQAGITVSQPLRVLWAKHGVIERLFDPIKLWRAMAADVSGRALDCGHYLAEEQPQAVLDEIRNFLLR